MRTPFDDTIPLPPNAFAAEYLELLAERDEPVTAAEADVAGPWHLEAHPSSGWAVLRQGESLESSQPVAIFSKKDAARLAAAVLPSTGRRSRYRLGKDPTRRRCQPFREVAPSSRCRTIEENHESRSHHPPEAPPRPPSR
jgi:hypothetical protein